MGNLPGCTNCGAHGTGRQDTHVNYYTHVNNHSYAKLGIQAEDASTLSICVDCLKGNRNDLNLRGAEDSER